MLLNTSVISPTTHSDHLGKKKKLSFFIKENVKTVQHKYEPFSLTFQ